MNTIVEKVQALFEQFNSEVSKHLTGNKAAGTRARKASLEIEKALKSFRKESIEASKK